MTVDYHGTVSRLLHAMVQAYGGIIATDANGIKVYGKDENGTWWTYTIGEHGYLTRLNHDELGRIIAHERLNGDGKTWEYEW